MSIRATAGGRLARFAHLAGLARPKADDAPVTQDDLDEVKDDLEDVKDDAEEVEDRVDDLEDDVDGKKDDDEEAAPPPADKPEEAKAYRRGQKAGAKAERKRCASIFAAPEAAQNLPLAASLAFESRVTATEARGLLCAGVAGARAQRQATAPKPAAAQAGLLERMATRRPVRLGMDTVTAPKPEADMNTPEGAAAFVLSAGRPAARGQK